MRKLIALFLLLSLGACATIDVNVCEQEEWKKTCSCDRTQDKCQNRGRLAQ